MLAKYMETNRNIAISICFHFVSTYFFYFSPFCFRSDIVSDIKSIYILAFFGPKVNTQTLPIGHFSAKLF